MSVYSDLEKIKQIKKQIHTSIANKEVAIADDLPFDQYPSKIDKITGGGGSISGQEFTITNNTGSDIKQGDLVWIDWAPYVESESKITNIKSYRAPTILDPSGQYAYNGKEGQYLSIDDLTVENSQSDFYNSSFYPQDYVMSDNGELFYSLNSTCSAGDGYGSNAYRSDLIYKSYSSLKIPGDTSGAKRQAIFYAGENFFIRTSKSPGDDYPYIQLFQIDTSTAKVLRSWRPGNSYTRAGDIAYFGTSSWIFRENGKTYLIDFYHGMRYELDMSSTENNPIVEGVSSQALGIIAVKGLTKDNKYMIVSGRTPTPGGSSWNESYPFQIYKRGANIDEWTLISYDSLSSNLQGLYNTYLYAPFYNPINQVVTLFNTSYNGDGLKPGKAFRYIGENTSEQMIWEELPCDLSKFTPDNPDKDTDNVWNFGPTYSQDCGKYVMFKSLANGERVLEYQVGYAKTGIFLKAVKDPSNLGAFAIQGVAKQDIANNSSGKITTLALEKVNIQLKSDVELDDILVSTGV